METLSWIIQVSPVWSRVFRSGDLSGLWSAGEVTGWEGFDVLLRVCNVEGYVRGLESGLWKLGRPGDGFPPRASRKEYSPANIDFSPENCRVSNLQNYKMIIYVVHNH